ncbi:uncharacterized protein MYCGRDRAFT_106603 [Zymoseptoria tritici IPO323]|uniref:Uncharacterized protein n=1 Tax=Zymoseptoria tritici (strain CBS 115943 / IPO323) TaxID=336722 RepID=F9XQU5_ZYMTI|nr:uncharacterized protein MYCGRDRAFT_106603 [Zymoseptoria tritici IPO323]EGP82423.1 hypothetical protein MYCGRDRAFT_106603 [Zymoseptoria tritici IPO323]
MRLQDGGKTVACSNSNLPEVGICKFRKLGSSLLRGVHSSADVQTPARLSVRCTTASCLKCLPADRVKIQRQRRRRRPFIQRARTKISRSRASWCRLELHVDGVL